MKTNQQGEKKMEKEKLENFGVALYEPLVDAIEKLAEKHKERKKQEEEKSWNKFPI
jgi:hypothetical protein